MLKLWRLNKITGYWVIQRLCAPETATLWLEVYQKDEPEELFVLSKNKPR